MRALQTAFAVAVIAVFSLACGRDEEAVAPAPTASPTPVSPSPTLAVKGQLWRWVNVTVVIPEGSPVYASPQLYVPPEMKPPSGGLALLLGVEHPSAGTVSGVVIDAETGAILQHDVQAEDQPSIDQVLKTLAVAALDPATSPWPYGDGPLEGTVERVGNVVITRPSPATGIFVLSGVSDSFEGPSNSYLEVYNGRSRAFVFSDTGDRGAQNDIVAAEDKAAFERFLSAIQLCGRDVKC